MLREQLDALRSAEANRGRQIREGYRIVILGEPNAGKSSLFNAFLPGRGGDRHAWSRGTTRDIIEPQLRIGPYSVLLYDTAGLRETDEVVEREGIRRARGQGRTRPICAFGWSICRFRPLVAAMDVLDDDLLVFSKADLVSGVSRETLRGQESGGFQVSTGDR